MNYFTPEARSPINSEEYHVEFDNINGDFILLPIEEVSEGIRVGVTREDFEATGVLRLIRPKKKGDTIDLGGYKVELDDPIELNAKIGRLEFSGVVEIEVESEGAEELFEAYDRYGLQDAREEFWKEEAERRLNMYGDDEEFVEIIEGTVDHLKEKHNIGD